jgi:hypothetical protein
MPAFMTDLAALQSVFAQQAAFCRSSGSPFSALVLEAIARRIHSEPTYRDFLRPWTEASVRQLFDAAVTLRLLGAFHYLVLSGRAPDLAALYPPQTALPDPDVLETALAGAAVEHTDVIEGFMASPPQTNEVARSLCLVGGFLTVAAQTGLPLRCLELGASAGLNMNWDRYRYDFGAQSGTGAGAGWGDPAAPVHLSGDWEGPPPPLVEARVVERAACDQNPIDVNDPNQALRLQSYVWADQTHRLERLRAAIALKQHTGGIPERADAADWAQAHVKPKRGVATIVYHSSFIFYPPKAVQARIAAAIEAAGAQASPDAPIAWLSKEPEPSSDAGSDELCLRLWMGREGDGEMRRLAQSHAHCAWVRWEG